MESGQNDSPTVDTIAYLESQGVPTDDEDDEDIHFCKKCKQVFKNLGTYLEHKVKHDKFKVAYNRAPGDRRMVLPTLKKKETVEKPTEAEGQGENDQQSGISVKPRRRRKRKSPSVDIQLIAERNTYICSTCDRKFSREASLKWHIQYDHKTDGDSEEEEEDEKELEEEAMEVEDPQDANYRVKEPPAKRVHQSNEDDRPFKCEVCGMGFKEVPVLKAHMLTHSNVRQFRCTYEDCPYAFKTKGSLVRHVRRHTGERPYACESCGRSFAESGALTRHMRSRNPCTSKTDADLPRYGKKWTYVPNIPAVVSQDKSGDGFVSMVPGEMVMVVTEGENGEQILTEAQVVSNNETVSSLGETMMEEGEVTESEVGELVAASDVHTYTPTQCKVCREECLEVEALRAHLRLHLADFPFHCGFCHFTTEERHDLQSHIQSKHIHQLKGIDPNILLPPNDNARKVGHQSSKDNTDAQTAVKQLLELPTNPAAEEELTETLSARAISRCPICNRVFRGSSYLKQHMKSHAGDRPHECPVCHKSFVTRDALNKHVIVHTDERNFKCGVCDKLFKRIAHVREHLKIHSAERPFPCNVCDKSFKTNNALKVHVRTHSNCFPYECHVCHRHFREKGSMQRHMRTHTGERPFRCPRCGRGFAEHGTLNRHLKAKVQCDHYRRLQAIDREESSLELEIQEEEETQPDTGADIPTVLAEFSSVVADTQQYIVADHLADGDTQTTEYVVLHTDLASEDIQNVEIVTEGDIDPDTILSTVAGSDSSYVVVSEAGNHLRIIDSSTGLTVATMPANSDQLPAVTVVPSNEVVSSGTGLTAEPTHIPISQRDGGHGGNPTEDPSVLVPGSETANTITVLTDSTGHIILTQEGGSHNRNVTADPVVVVSGSETMGTVTVHTDTEAVTLGQEEVLCDKIDEAASVLCGAKAPETVTVAMDVGPVVVRQEETSSTKMGSTEGTLPSTETVETVSMTTGVESLGGVGRGVSEDAVKRAMMVAEVVGDGSGTGNNTSTGEVQVILAPPTDLPDLSQALDPPH